MNEHDWHYKRQDLYEGGQDDRAIYDIEEKSNIVI